MSLTTWRKASKAAARRLFNRPIIMEYRTGLSQRWALLSYICLPFLIDRKSYFSHTNYDEAWAWLNTLQMLGYNVLICNFSDDISDRRLKQDIDVVVGFGKTFNRLCKGRKPNQSFIYYGTGQSWRVVEERSKRLEVHLSGKLGGSNWNIRSGLRLTPEEIKESEELSDAIVCLGNNIVANSYCGRRHKLVYSLDAFYLLCTNSNWVIQENPIRDGNDILWFGSHGIFHKGLHNFRMVLEAHPSVNLHICGEISSEERELISTYYSGYEKRMFIYGAIDPYGQEALRLYTICRTAILPSASEGGSPGLITIVRASGLIPIYTDQCGVEFPEGLRLRWQEDLSEQVLEAYNEHLSMDDYARRGSHNKKYIDGSLSYGIYKNRLYSILSEILSQ